MSVKASAWVWENSNTTGNERIVMLVLADEANDDGFSCYPGIKRIADKARISERTVQRCLERISQLGEILIRRPEKQGKGMHNQYALCLGRTAQYTADLLGWPDSVISADVIHRASDCHPLEDLENDDERVTNDADSDSQRVSPVSYNPPIRKYPLIDIPPNPLKGDSEDQTKIPKSTALTVECPACRAKPNQHCIRSGGQPREQCHKPRYIAAGELTEDELIEKTIPLTVRRDQAIKTGKHCQPCDGTGWLELPDNPSEVRLCRECDGTGISNNSTGGLAQ